MGLRRFASAQRRRQTAAVRRHNRKHKARERLSRDRRMVVAIKEGQLPFVSWVMNWLSSTLGKPSHLITPADVDQAVTQATARG